MPSNGKTEKYDDRYDEDTRIYQRTEKSQKLRYPRADEDRPIAEPDSNGYFRTWSEVVSDAAKARGLTYSILADMWDMSLAGAKRRVYNANPSLKVMEAVADAFNLHLDEILARRRYPKRIPRSDEWGREDTEEKIK